MGRYWHPQPPFNFCDETAPIYTHPRYLPPSKFLDCQITESIIGDGCILKQSRVQGSVLRVRFQLESGCVIDKALLMGADFYQADLEHDLEQQSVLPNHPALGVGANTTIRRAIIDKNARIGCNVKILNKDQVEEADREQDGFYIRSGIRF